MLSMVEDTNGIEGGVGAFLYNPNEEKKSGSPCMWPFSWGYRVHARYINNGEGG